MHTKYLNIHITPYYYLNPSYQLHIICSLDVSLPLSLQDDECLKALSTCMVNRRYLHLSPTVYDKCTSQENFNVTVRR